MMVCQGEITLIQRESLTVVARIVFASTATATVFAVAFISRRARPASVTLHGVVTSNSLETRSIITSSAGHAVASIAYVTAGAGAATGAVR